MDMPDEKNGRSQVSGQPELTGKAAIVTGASRGIGLAAAQSLASLGAAVILTSRSQESADAAAASVAGTAVGFRAHATDGDRAHACVAFAIQEFGRLDFLVNNAGTNPAFGPLVSMDHGRFAKTFDVNVWAPVMWTGLAWRAWMGEHGGSIINTASIGGQIVGANLGIYNASKAALIHLTRQLAIELAPAVRVNAVAPGIVRTKLAAALWTEREEMVNAVTPLGRIGEPEDVGTAIAFLCSERASWITGHTLVIDGGQRLVAPAGGDKPGRPG
jgi:NAD(P)-dependent dehydrogenase (short-subunit alcohol dehydrogenase family)